ncbi:putative ribonuclease H-like domain-containing protein [Tanacetum coccineum]
MTGNLRGVTNALADTRESVSVLPFSLYKNLGLSDPRPYHSNLTMANNTQAKAMEEVRNVRIQIGYQAYLVDFLVLNIPVNKELPLLLGRLFLRTYEAVIDIGYGTMSIDDGVIRHTYFPKPRAKAYLENFEIDKEHDWLSCFEVGRDEDGNPKYDPVAPSFLDIEDEMERALEMEAYFNPFKNIIVFKKLINFLVIQAVLIDHEDLDHKLIDMTLKRNGLKWQIQGRNRRRDGMEYLANRDGNRTGKKEESKALVTVDGESIDWTTHSKDDEDYALMANNNSGSNIQGIGPNWLFDLDYLTDSMNYHNDSEENQANLHVGQQESKQDSGTKDKIDSGNSQIEDETDQDCFLNYPICILFLHNKSSSTSDGREEVQEKKTKTFWMILQDFKSKEKESYRKLKLSERS